MRTLALVLSALLASAPAPPQTPPGRLDDAQAQLFLRFLRAVARGDGAGPLVDSVLAAPGTALVIAQQNLSRRVSPAEYREVLLAAAERREPVLEFDRDDPRAVKGAEGLLRDVLPSVRWGAQHVDLLAARVSAISPTHPAARARALALANLPERVTLDVPLYVVLGGRAGAAASDSGIYFDVLANSYRDRDRYPRRARIVEFFAHELHHVGLGRLLDREEAALRLDAAGRRVFALLRGLIMEGSASYLINGHHHLAAMRRDPAFATPATDRERLAAVERVLAGVLEDGWTEAEYDQAMTYFTGNALHRTGAAMLDAIWRARGRSAVMAALRDPRRLLQRYDEAVDRQSDRFRFPTALAQRVAHLGD